MFRTNPRIIKSCRNRIYRCNLTIFILTKIRLHSMEDTYASCINSSRCLLCIYSPTCRFATDKLNRFILYKLIKHSHGVASATYTSHNYIRKSSFFF